MINRITPFSKKRNKKQRKTKKKKKRERQKQKQKGYLFLYIAFWKRGNEIFKKLYLEMK